MTHDVRLRAGCPDTEYSLEFLQGMLDRMSMSYFKYGAVADAYPHSVDALACARERIARYGHGGNLEELIEAANYLMIEFLAPARDDAHFRATDSDGSPGRVRHDGARTKVDNETLRRTDG